MARNDYLDPMLKVFDVFDAKQNHERQIMQQAFRVVQVILDGQEDRVAQAQAASQPLLDKLAADLAALPNGASK